MKELENRIAYLECQIKDGRVSDNVLGSHHPPVTEQVRYAPISEPPSEDEATADAMGAATESKHVHAEHEDFYGASSALSFMRLVEAATSAERHEPGRTGSSTTPNSRSARYSMLAGRGLGRDAHVDPSLWALPPRHTADNLVNCYFTYVYSLYPFIHQQAFMEAYHDVWYDGSKQKSREHAFFCVLNVVFAFGSLFSSERAQQSGSKHEISHAYFDLARRHLRFDIIAGDPGSLAIMQCLLLIGQYLQATEKPSACWNVVGLAIRIAQELGIDREQQVMARPSMIDQQLRRRLWYGCVLMDRIVSTTYGRPLMIAYHFDLRPPAFIDDVHIRDEGLEEKSEGSPSVLQFFFQTLTLYDILADILERLYNGRSTSESNENSVDGEMAMERLSHVLSVEGKLSKWRAGIPKCLLTSTYADAVGSPDRAFQVTSSTEETSGALETVPFLRQAVILEARYRHVQIMLYRPVLLPHGGPKAPQTVAGLWSDAEKSACKICVSAAVSLIKLIDGNKETPNVPASWYNMFYTYTSATVLLAARIRPLLKGELGDDMASAWTMALALLRKFEDDGNRSATRCLRVLEVLHQKISRAGLHDAEPMFDYLPDLVDPTVDLMSQPDNFFFTMISDQNGPFDGNMFDCCFGGGLESFHV